MVFCFVFYWYVDVDIDDTVFAVVVVVVVVFVVVVFVLVGSYFLGWPALLRFITVLICIRTLTVLPLVWYSLYQSYDHDIRVSLIG